MPSDDSSAMEGPQRARRRPARGERPRQRPLPRLSYWPVRPLLPLSRAGRPAPALLLGVALLAAACGGEPSVGQPPSVSSTPVAGLPSIRAIGPVLRECFPTSARNQGVPEDVPVPTTVKLQGPDTYQADLGFPERPTRISGTGFEYEVAADPRLVAGFYDACLDAFGPRGWEHLRPEDGNDVFRVPRRTDLPVVVLVARNRTGPTAVVIFVDYELAH